METDPKVSDEKAEVPNSSVENGDQNPKPASPGGFAEKSKRMSTSRPRSKSTAKPKEAENKRRRTSLLGNLLTGGRVSRGFSLHRMTYHLATIQRAKKSEMLPSEDYYLLEELDTLGIFLEKPEDIPGGIPASLTAPLFTGTPQSPPKPRVSDQDPAIKEPDADPNTLPSAPRLSDCPPPPPEEPIIPPDHAVFPVGRNTVELQNKLTVFRNLRTYVKHNEIDEGKCYYGEDEIDLSFLTVKPKTFLIFGKPGAGKTTLAMKLAEKLHAVHLNPEGIIEYFRHTEPLSSVKVNETLENGDSLGDGVVIELLDKRIKEFDILHRGYVLEGFPMVTSDDLPVYQQLEGLSKLALPPEYLIIIQMQDKDLYKRRINQKLDPESWKVYTQKQYSQFDSDELIYNRHRRVSTGQHRHSLSEHPITPQTASDERTATEDLSDTAEKLTATETKKSRTSTPEDVNNMSPNEIDFPKLPAEVLERIFYRTEDFNIIVNDDLESFRYNFEDLQEYVQNFNKRKTLEVDGYWSPTVMFRRVWEFCEAIGIQPVPVPTQIMRSLAMLYFKKRNSGEDYDGEDEDDYDYDDDDDDIDANNEIEGETECQEDEQQAEIDWVSAIRAVAVRGLVDPRFRWRLSRWMNLCPVALKLGRSLAGKPELAVSFMDKVFFMSSKHAVDQFINNPRPYLLPKMPTSPVKFIVIGHPLAGKSTFAHELAVLTEATVIDMTREVIRRFSDVKREFIWKKHLKYVLEATNLVNRENAMRWQRQERTRRRDMHAWIENHLKALAESEIEAALERDWEFLHKLRLELRNASEYHAMGEPFAGTGMCQSDDATLHFNWKKFVGDAFGGKQNWTHQELLQLAWDLFHERRLYYKRKLRDSVEMTLFNENLSESDEEYGLISDVLGKGSPSNESSEEDTSFDDAGISGQDDEGVEDDDTADDETEIEERKKVRRAKRKKKKRKCRLQVKPVLAEDILEPFLFESFDVDPEHPEVEESVRMRFPMIPFELVDIVPSPSLVGEVDPIVQLIVEEKLNKDVAYVDSMPPDIFAEILKRACTEVEVKYRKNNRHGPMTGGWIVENFPPDIDKWRAVLRIPQICPDQVFLLLDLTEGNMTIWSRFKKLFKLLHPPKPESVANSISARTPRTTAESLEIPGEQDAKDTMRRYLGTPGEDHEPELRGSRGSRQSPRGSGGVQSTENESELEDQDDGDIDNYSFNLISRSHFILSLLPRDDLVEICSITSSEKDVINRDLHRNRTTAFSNIESADDLEKTMEGHEKYILETLEMELAENEAASYTSFDLDEYQEGVVTKFKPIYVEMSACIEEMDAFHNQHPVMHRVSSLGSEEVKHVLKNPPGTPETGQHSEPEDLVVAVPLEIETGEVELTPEEFELKTVLEAEIRRLSKTDDYIKTPTEMGSATSILPASAESGGPYNLIQRLRSAKIESPKRKFFAQVRIFNEFWNMALPVCNQQGVRYWEVGLCDEEIALEKSIFIWTELESRFDPKAKKILETELKEEDEEVLESLMRWGEPYDLTDMRFRSATKPEQSQDNSETDDDDDDNDDDDETAEEEKNSSRKTDKDELTSLENKPEQYWKAIKRIEAERCFGDFKYYCPVTYADIQMLRYGSPKYACKFKDRLYYCSDENSQLRFSVNPRQFLPIGGPPKPPPPRICITGSPGCLQEEIASQVCNEYKVCYVNFRQRLHEIMKARFGREVGPERTGQIVSKERTQKIIATSKPGDDLLFYKSTPLPEDDEGGVGVHFGVKDEGKLDSEVEIDLTFQQTLLPSVSGILNIIPSQEILDREEQKAIQEATLKSLGLLSQTAIETVPLNSIERTERLTERKWEKLTRIETYIQAFLENGIQLPDDVLDEFLQPLWKEAPFTEVGFVLVGFPNSEADVQYMINRNFIPEHVFVMECKSIAIRNRLIVPSVDRWHKEQNPSGKRKRRLTRRTNDAKLHMSRAVLGFGAREREDIFPYQVEGRAVADEYEYETWTYSDTLSRDISRALKYFHGIYSSGLDKMKKSLNKDRICWTPVDTNLGLHQGKHKVMNSIMPMLKYRNNIFEDCVRLSFPAAQALLDRGVFSLSRLHRWCPVEVSKGNTGINVWNAPGVKKIPYLYRRFIYFLAGEKNAQHFEENTINLASQTTPLQPVPLVCMILGRPKSGKTTLAKKLSQRLGLLYVSGLEVIESVATHAFVTQWGQFLSEVNPALVSSGHQPMTLATEILEYIREGRAIPRFLMYRCLDLYLLNPKAQCHGIVFDDFPTGLDELIEINYREMSPCIVIDLKVPITEAYARCDRNRKMEILQDTIPEDGHDGIDNMWDQYDQATVDTCRWFAEEYQNIHIVDGEQNPEMVYQNAAELCVNGQRKIQDYLMNLYYGKPNTLEGTCPITSTLFHRLNPDFGFFCPVALNDSDELVSVREISDLAQVVEYKGQIYLFSGKHAVRKFINNPKRYTVPGCLRTPPQDIPQTLNVSPEDFIRLQEHWGFMDFDPVLYYANHHYKGLQRGDPQYCVVYRGKLYIFINEDNQRKFMRKPSKFWNLLLPMKIPKKAEPINYDKITPFGYLTAKGMIPMLRKILKLMAEKRPRGPFMNVDQCAALYMGYYLKTQNMNSPFHRRQKYRDAMFKMSSLKASTRDFLKELQPYYGCRTRTLPDRLRKQLAEFVKFEKLPIEEKVDIPKIPGVTLGYDAVKTPFSEPQVSRKVRRMMENLQDVEFKEKMESFSAFSRRKKTAQEAAERAAQDAEDAVELAFQKEEKSRLRLLRKSQKGNKSSRFSSIGSASYI